MTPRYTAATMVAPSTTGDLSAATAKLYEFTNPCFWAIVQLDYDSGSKLYLKWNAAAAGDVAVTGTPWVQVVAGSPAVSPEGVMITSVAVICADALTYQTDFNVVGFEVA